MKYHAIIDLEEAKRWTVRLQQLMTGGISDAVLNDIRVSLAIIEKYIDRSIGFVKEIKDGD